MKTIAKTVNLDQLKKRTQGNPEVMREIMQIFLEETPTFIDKMRQGVKEKNWELLRSGAHSLIPSLAIIGISPEYEAMARTIQEFASRKETSRLALLENLVNKIEYACTAAYKELEEEMPVYQK